MIRLRVFLLLILTFGILLWSAETKSLSAAHFENYIDVTLKVEDMSYNLVVKSVTFNGEEVPLDKADFFNPRKIVQYKLLPGKYMLTWKTQKGTGKWADEGIILHERILVLESGDTTVRVNIKGTSITLY